MLLPMPKFAVWQFETGPSSSVQYDSPIDHLDNEIIIDKLQIIDNLILTFI